MIAVESEAKDMPRRIGISLFLVKRTTIGRLPYRRTTPPRVVIHDSFERQRQRYREKERGKGQRGKREERERERERRVREIGSENLFASSHGRPAPR